MNDVHWRELYHEVVESGLCTGCAACVMVCPRDVLGYTDDYYLIQIGEGMAQDQCVIGDRGCDICTRACPPVPQLGVRPRRGACLASRARPTRSTATPGRSS